MRTLFAFSLLLLAGLAGCADSTTDDPEDVREQPGAPLAAAAPALDAAAVLADLQHFASTYAERADNTEAHEGARQWIADGFEAAGLTVWRQNFTDGIDQANIVGIKWGEDRSTWVVVGGHYDMTHDDCLVPAAGCPVRQFSQGAYDDGSGTLLTVHLAKAFANLTLPYTVAFVAFDGEERGLQGSGAFVRAFQDGEFPYPVTSLRAMLDLDMFGLNWPGTDAPILFLQNSPELLGFVQANATDLGIPDTHIVYDEGIALGTSDYGNFYAIGVPTGFFISDFEKWQPPANLPVVVPAGAYPFWHLADTYETMELMAGSAEDLQAGFQTAADLSTNVLWFMLQPESELTATTGN